jgi:hypothetical protein
MERCRGYVATVLLALTVLAGCAKDEQVGFPVLPPIANANPALRTDQVLALPATLVAEYKTDYVLLRPGNLEPVTLQVGSKMVLGVEATHRVHWGDEFWGDDFYKDRSGMGSPVNLARESWLIYPQGLPPANTPQRAVAIKTTVRVFETDIPAQHMWCPKAGKYKVLWERTFETPVPFEQLRYYKGKGS